MSGQGPAHSAASRTPNLREFITSPPDKFTDIDLCKLKPNYNDLIKEYNHAK